MNLAEIRLKAQRERERGAHAEIPAADLQMQPKDLICEEEEMCAGVFSEVSTGVSHMPPQIADQQIQTVFDPLGAILAGRACAGCNEEALLETLTPAEIAGAEQEELLWFRVASERYAINIMEIKEIIKPREVTEVPRVPAFVAGVLSLRGIIIPVFDMRMRLGLSSSGATGKERIIVVKKEEDFCGMLVDEVVQVVKIAASSIEQPPAVLDGIDRDFVNGIGRFNGQMLILLDLHNILDMTLC